MESIRLSYTFAYTPEACALIQGIVIRRRRIPVRSEAVLSIYQILKSVMIRWGILLLLSGLLDLYFYRNGRIVLAGIFLVWIILGFLFSFGGVLSSFIGFRKKLPQFLAHKNRAGELVIDDAGLEDSNDDGTITKCLWAELDFCVVTDYLIVFFFGNTMIYLNYSAAAEHAICEVLAELGQEKRFCRRSILGSADPNKIL